jgi:sporulation protein YlmC with PRC-barrel domain
MIRSLKELLSYKVKEINAEIGIVEDFVFDEKHWKIRYLEIDMGIGFTGEKLLVGKDLLKKPNWGKKYFSISVTMNQLKKAPKLKKYLVFTREKENMLNEYYGTPSYWNYTYVPQNEMKFYDQKKIIDEKIDSELISFNEFLDFEIVEENKVIAHCLDVLIDDVEWEIKSLIVTITGNIQIKMKEVMLPIDWIEKINYKNRKIFINKDKGFIKNAPTYSRSNSVKEIYGNMLDNHKIQVRVLFHIQTKVFAY